MTDVARFARLESITYNTKSNSKSKSKYSWGIQFLGVPGILGSLWSLDFSYISIFQFSRFFSAFFRYFSRFFVATAKVAKSWIFIGGQFRGDFWTPWVILSRLGHSQNFISFSHIFVHFCQILNRWSYPKIHLTKVV